MCMALTPSDHSSSRRPEAKWQAGRVEGEVKGESGGLNYTGCVKSEPLSELVCMGEWGGFACVCNSVQVSMRMRYKGETGVGE